MPLYTHTLFLGFRMVSMGGYSRVVTALKSPGDIAG